MVGFVAGMLDAIGVLGVVGLRDIPVFQGELI
jgi:hypothetical protein